MNSSFSTHLCSISCFMSMPCFSNSSLWAKTQSTGSTGVSAHGVLSRSRRACSGSLKRNTWLFPMIMRFPKKRTGTLLDIRTNVTPVCFVLLLQLYLILHIPDRRTTGAVTLFPLTYVSASSHGSKTTQPVQGKIIGNEEFTAQCKLEMFMYVCYFYSAVKAACTFSLRACGAAEGAVFIFDKMATQNNVLSSFGIFTTNPELPQENLRQTSSLIKRNPVYVV